MNAPHEMPPVELDGAAEKSFVEETVGDVLPFPHDELEDEDPSFDVESWFARKNLAVQKLKERYHLLIEELARVKDQLLELGIRMDEPATRRAAQAPEGPTKKKRTVSPHISPEVTSRPRKVEKKRNDNDPRTQVAKERENQVYSVLNTKPQRARDVADKLGWKYSDVANALKRLHDDGRVHHTMTRAGNVAVTLWARA